MATSDYQLGPCDIVYDEASLGKTTGGVTVTIERTHTPLNTDQDGESPVDEYVTGTTVTVEGALAEITLENIATLYNTSIDGSNVVIGTAVGTSLLTNSKEMIIKPYDGGSVSNLPEDWITLYHAGLKATAALTYNATDQRSLAFTASGYPNDSGNVVVFGDTAA